jgi:hypothetical protein
MGTLRSTECSTEAEEAKERRKPERREEKKRNRREKRRENTSDPVSKRFRKRTPPSGRPGTIDDKHENTIKMATGNPGEGFPVVILRVLGGSKDCVQHV